LLRHGSQNQVPNDNAIGRLIDLVTPAEAVNFFTAAGYEPD
jgi:hypothetical protein